MKLMIIQEAIQEILDEKVGLSKHQLAAVLGCTQPQIANYLNGKSKKPNIKVIYAIYRIYNIIVLPFTSPMEIEKVYKARYETVSTPD